MVASVLMTVSAVAQQHPSQSDKFNTYFYQGVLAANQRNYAEAFDLLAHCYRLDSTNAALQYQLSRLYYGMDDAAKSTSLLEGAYRAEPNNLVYAEGLATIYTNQNQFDKAIAIYQKLQKAYPTQENPGMRLADLYGRSGDIDRALAEYTRLQKEFADSPSDHFRYIGIKGQLYKMAGRDKELVREYQSLIKQYPDVPEFAYRLSDIYLENKQPTEAQKLLDELGAKGHDDAQYHMARFRYYRTIEDRESVRREMAVIFGDKEMPMEDKMRLQMALVQQDLDAEGKPKPEYNPLWERIMAEYPEEAAPKMTYAQILDIQGNSVRAQEMMMTLVQKDPSNILAWDYLVNEAIRRLDYDTIISRSLDALRHIPERASYYIYAASAYVEKKHTPKAKTLLQKALKTLNPKDGEGLAEVYGFLGSMEGDAGNIQKMYEYYDKALTHNANNTSVLNNYAYELTKDKGNLAKAERMAALAVKLAPDVPTFLDTYGWVFFCKGSYSLAKLYIQKAVDLTENEPDADILEHLGDVYACMEDMEQAIMYWQKARQTGKGSDLLDKKINEKKYLAPR